VLYGRCDWEEFANQNVESIRIKILGVIPANQAERTTVRHDHRNCDEIPDYQTQIVGLLRISELTKLAVSI
jgi:hypothetical protein